MSTQEFVKPEVGTGATLNFPQDSYPYVVTKVSASGKTITVEPLQIVNLSTGHAPAYFEGPFPVWSHTYTPEELQTLTRPATLTQGIVIRYGKNGWAHKSLRFTVGEARYHRNYSY